MQEDINLNQQIASLLISVVLVAVGLMLRKRAEEEGSPMLLTAWSISKTDFFLLVWFMLMFVFLVSSVLGKGLIREVDIENDDQVVLWNALVSALAMQVPLITLFIILYVFPYTRQLMGVISVVSKNYIQLFKSGFVLLMAGMPAFMGVSIIWGLLITLLIMAGLPITGEPQTIVTLIAEAEFGFNVIGLVFAAVVLAPIAEELLFRGMLYRFFRQQMSMQMAAWVTGILFALIHFSIVAFVPLVFLGYYLARCYERTADIRVPIVIHGLFNALMLVRMLVFNVLA